MAWPAILHRDEAVFALPIAHIMGFTTLMGLACLGVPVFLLPSFRPVEVLDAIEERRATVFIGVPAMYRMMEEAGAEHRDLTSIRIWGSGADAMPADLARRFKKMGATATLPLIGPIGEATFLEGYGMVEVGGGVAAKLSPPMLDVGLGESIGFQLAGYRFRVVDDDGHDVRHRAHRRAVGAGVPASSRATGTRRRSAPAPSPRTAGSAPATSCARARSAP